jgi:hypothetical protein
VVRTTDRSEYMKQLGAARIDSLAVREHALSAPADFGY